MLSEAFKAQREVTSRQIRMSPTRATLFIFLVGTCVFLAVKIFSFLASSAPPFGYYYDLGVNASVTAYMVDAIRSPADLRDNLGWAHCCDAPTFNFNPSLSYFILVPLAKLIGGAWSSVKFIQVVQEVLAFYGAASLYATIRGRNIWAIVAGLLYALLPTTSLDIRGNVDIGWVVALTPLSLALAIQLVRRYGDVALPVCGIICGFFGFCFASEYVFLTSIPCYLFIVSITLRRDQMARGVALSVTGLVGLVAIGSFFILPTLSARHLFTDPASRTASLAGGAELQIYSESWRALLTLIPQEFIVSPQRQFNASAGLAEIAPATAILWLGAFLCTVTAFRAKRSRGGSTAAIGGAVLLVLALGAYAPLGEAIWSTLHLLPGLVLLRTPDRLLLLPALFIVLAAVWTLERLHGHCRKPIPAVAVLLTVTSIVLLADFAFRQHCLTTESDVALLEPDLSDVNNVVSSIGGRTISYAFAQGGSQFYTTGYGVPTPTLWYMWDITGHYNLDGLGGSGIFRRAMVRSVIASPNWSSDSPSLPNAHEIDRKFPGRVAFSGSSGLMVKELAGRSVLTGVRATCIRGGPGLLDWAASIPEFQDASFVRESTTCDSDLSLDFDPRAAAVASETWDADLLFPNLPTLRDTDYSFVVGRAFINDDWYRNSVDGDEVLCRSGARNITEPLSFNLDVPLARANDKRVLLVRLASHVATVLTVVGSSERQTSVQIVPRLGMRVYQIPLKSIAGSTSATLKFGTFAAAGALSTGFSGMAFDRVTLVDDEVPVRESRRASALFSIPKLLRPDKTLDAEVSGELAVVSRSGIVDEAGPAGLTEVALNGRGTIQYRWTGTAGDYLIEASARLSGAGATLALTRGRVFQACCTNSVSADSGDLARVFLRAHLARGSIVTLRMAYPLIDAGASASLDGLRVARIAAVSGYEDAGGREQFVLPDFSDPLRSLANASQSNRIEFDSGAAHGAQGSFIEHVFLPRADASDVSVRVDSSGDGSATLALTCGRRTISKIIQPPSTYLSMAGNRIHGCRTRISWGLPGLAVSAVRADFLENRLPEARARLWLSRGSYKVRVYGPGVLERKGGILVDGHESTGDLAFARDGFHDVTLERPAIGEQVLGFLQSLRSLSSKDGDFIVRHSTFDWKINHRSRGTIEVASFPDGNWRLQHLERAHDVVLGTRCDLVNTCFVDVAPGNYELRHLWPVAFVQGLWISAAAILLAVLPLVVREFPERLALRKRVDEI